MTILKSVIITVFIIVIFLAFDFLFIILNDDLTNYQTVSILYDISSHLTAYSLALLYFKLSKDNFPLTNSIDKRKNKALVFTIFLFLIASQLINLPFFDWKILSNKYLGKSFVLSKYSNYNYSTFLLFKGISALIISPFFEEHIFRYYIFGGLLKKYSFLTSVLISSILFSSIHLASPRNLVPTFILGIICAVIYYNTKKIKYSIYMHLLYNFFWFITFVFSGKYQDFKNYMGYGIFYWVLFFLGISLLCLGFKLITNNKFGLVKRIYKSNCSIK